MGGHKVVPFPTGKNLIMFLAGTGIGLFFPEMLFQALKNVTDDAPQFLIDKVERVGELMSKNAMWTGIGLAIGWGTIQVFKFLSTFFMGLVFGFAVRMWSIQFGYGIPTPKNWFGL